MNRKLPPLILNMIVVGNWIVGCGQAATPAPTATYVPSASPVPPSSTPAPTAGRTSTARLPTLTPIPTTTLIGRSVDKIAYTACTSVEVAETCEITVINTDGSDPIRLTNNNRMDCCPRWSPDGTKIAFISHRDGDTEIYVMNIDGSGLTQLTNNEVDDASAAWSPDGAKIAFRSGAAGNSEIFVMDADGSDWTNLTNHNGWDFSPAWSPDGGRVAFVSERDGNFEIYVMNADGSGQTNLTNHSGDGAYRVDDTEPAWSPDGAKIAFTANREGSNWEIYMMNADGSGLANLTNNSAADGSPAWSPDGARITFNSGVGGAQEIYLMNADGSGRTQLTQTGGSGPSWSPIMSDPLKPLPDCTSGWTRLTAGGHAKVSEVSTTPNRVRDAPSTAGSSITLLYPGSVVRLLEGPICAEGLVFWKVESELIPGSVGWTAEGDEIDYFLDPFAP